MRIAVRRRTQRLPAWQLRVGIGSTNSLVQKWDYNWTEARLAAFVGWLEQQVWYLRRRV